MTDLIRNRLIIFSASGRLLGEIGGPGTGAGEFRRPAGVALGPDGSVFVAERCGKRVQRFSPSGQPLEIFGKGTLSAPTFLAVDRDGDVFVSDYHRVVRFARRGALRRTTPPPAEAASHHAADVWCRRIESVDGGD